jgi:predicted dehydrogenase
VSDLAEMVEACRRNRVQFMDGVMFMHSARLPAMRALIDNDAGIGQVRRVTSAFSFSSSAEFFKGNIRVNSALEPFGCLGDLGWYCIRLSLCVMESKLPVKARGHIIHSSTGQASPDAVPTEFSGELLSEDGVSAGFFCSFHTATEQWAQVTGTSGILSVTDFVLPFFGAEVELHANWPVFNVTGCDFNLEEHRHRYAVPEYSNSQPTSQETNMIRNFVQQACSGSLNERWPDIALKTQAVMGACLDSARADGKWVSVPGTGPRAIPVLDKTARGNL